MAENIIESQFSKYQVDTTMERIFQFPLIRMIIAILFIFPIMLVVNIVIFYPFGFPDTIVGYINDLISIIYFLLMIIFYRWYVTIIEQRQPTEFSFKNGIKELLIGLGIGSVLILAVIGTIALLGNLKIDSYTGDFTPVLHLLFFLGASAFFEEILFRLIIFKLTEEYFGSWVALFIHAFLFGIIHLANPNATWTAAISITLSAGLMLAVVYMSTRKIWMVFGLHFIWNYIQGPVFGIAVSGVEVGSLFKSSPSGPDYLSGGAFGVEASIFPTIFCMIVFVYYLIKVVKQGNYLQPRWVRNKKNTS